MSTRSDRFQLRATPAEIEAWKRAAGFIPLSAWIREICNQAAALDVPPAAPHLELVAPRVVEIATTPGACPARVAPGQFCKRCGASH